MKFSQSFVVRPHEIDEQGHVNNVSYVRWIQDVAVAHWRFSAAPGDVEKYSWVVLRHEIDYKKPAFKGDEITAFTWVGEWSRTTCERFTEIRRYDELLAKSRTLWCMLTRTTSRPTRITEEIRSRFSASE